MTMAAWAPAFSLPAAAVSFSCAAVAAPADAVMASPSGASLEVPVPMLVVAGLARLMDWARRVLVPSRIAHDECRGHDLDPAERDEDAGVDGDGTCCGQKRRQKPCLKC